MRLSFWANEKAALSRNTSTMSTPYLPDSALDTLRISRRAVPSCLPAPPAAVPRNGKARSLYALPADPAGRTLRAVFTKASRRSPTAVRLQRPSSGTAVITGRGNSSSHSSIGSARTLPSRKAAEAEVLAMVRKRGWARSQCSSILTLESVGSSHASQRRFRMSAMATKTCGWVMNSVYQTHWIEPCLAPRLPAEKLNGTIQHPGGTLCLPERGRRVDRHDLHAQPPSEGAGEEPVADAFLGMAVARKNRTNRNRCSPMPSILGLSSSTSQGENAGLGQRGPYCPSGHRECGGGFAHGPAGFRGRGNDVVPEPCGGVGMAGGLVGEFKECAPGQARSPPCQQYWDPSTSTTPAIGMSRIRWKHRSSHRVGTTPHRGQPGGWSVSTTV